MAVVRLPIVKNGESINGMICNIHEYTVLLCVALLWLHDGLIINLCVIFTHTPLLPWLPYCVWCKSKRHQCNRPEPKYNKTNKSRIMCMFIGIYWTYIALQYQSHRSLGMELSLLTQWWIIDILRWFYLKNNWQKTPHHHRWEREGMSFVTLRSS